MSTPAPLKALVTGNVSGQYTKLFKRLNDVNTKAGPFDLLICCGNFFGGNDTSAYENVLLSGKVELSNVPIYILGEMPKQYRKFHPSVDNFEHGFELIDGVTYLGKSGILTTSQGLKIAYLNGRFHDGSSVPLSSDDNLEYFTEKDLDSLLMAYRGNACTVDILLTTQWPEDVFRYCSHDLSESALANIAKISSEKISQLCYLIRPRYHFVDGINLFYERVPFRNHRVLNEHARSVTRFISIASVANAQKMKWLYAFNIVPAKDLSHQELVCQPPGTTENPFVKLVQEMNEQAMFGPVSHHRPTGEQFFYSVDSNENATTTTMTKKNHHNKRGREQHEERRPPRKELKVDLENCWFCLASPNVDKTLIVSIGDYAYLALAKGGLTDDHLMILPIEHIRSSVEVEQDGLQDELARFKTALVRFYKCRNMVPVFFERNFKSAHFQIQVIGLPESVAPSLQSTVGKIFQRFEVHELSLNSELTDVLSSGVPYFYLECPEYYKFFVRINTKKEFFPLQIGRELLAQPELLNSMGRIGWQQCTISPEEAKERTRTIRNDFKPFDFTLE